MIDIAPGSGMLGDYALRVAFGAHFSAAQIQLRVNGFSHLSQAIQAKEILHREASKTYRYNAALSSIYSDFGHAGFGRRGIKQYIGRK